MATTVSATEAVRNFSELLNNIRYRGESYTVERGGKPVAALVPVEAPAAERTLREFRELFSRLPGLDPDDDAFTADILAGVDSLPAVPELSGWE